jgi:DNA primase
MSDKKTEFKYLKEHLIQTCDLPEFIETESGIDLKWNRTESEAVCECPMPDHYETKPSFHVSLINDVWLYHCFGCQKKGTIIHFCVDFLGLRNQYEAINYLCKYYNVKNVDDLILQGMKNVSKKVNFERQIENENILVSNQCRMLLKKNFNGNKLWVSNAYKELNKALLEQNYQAVERIGYEAFNRMKNHKGIDK